MGLPYLPLKLFGKISMEVPEASCAEGAEHLVRLGLAYTSKISDVDYDFIHFHRLTASGAAFQNWLREFYRTAPE